MHVFERLQYARSMQPRICALLDPSVARCAYRSALRILPAELRCRPAPSVLSTPIEPGPRMYRFGPGLIRPVDLLRRAKTASVIRGGRPRRRHAANLLLQKSCPRGSSDRFAGLTRRRHGEPEASHAELRDDRDMSGCRADGGQRRQRCGSVISRSCYGLTWADAADKRYGFSMAGGP